MCLREGKTGEFMLHEVRNSGLVGGNPLGGGSDSLSLFIYKMKILSQIC